MNTTIAETPKKPVQPPQKKTESVTLTRGAAQRPLNPDEEGKDDKYLYGGSRSRLLLALESGLPNEIDWAFNKLVKLSFNCPVNFHMGNIPGLLEAIIAPLEDFFKSFQLNLDISNFETTLSVEAYQRGLPDFSDMSMFNSRKFSQELERALQILHILRNFSFMEQNARFFVSHHAIVIILAKGVALPSSTLYIEVKQHCIDIFENIATHVNLRSKNDFFLACFRKLLFEQDRSFVLAAVRTLTRLCVNRHNEAVLAEMDPGIIQRMVQLLLLSDSELVTNILDYLYQYTSLSSETALKLVDVVDENIVKFLSSFLNWKVNHQPLALPRLIEIPALKGPLKAATAKEKQALDQLMAATTGNPVASNGIIPTTPVAPAPYVNVRPDMMAQMLTPPPYIAQMMAQQAQAAMESSKLIPSRSADNLMDESVDDASKSEIPSEVATEDKDEYNPDDEAMEEDDEGSDLEEEPDEDYEPELMGRKRGHPKKSQPPTNPSSGQHSRQGSGTPVTPATPINPMAMYPPGFRPAVGRMPPGTPMMTPAMAANMAQYFANMASAGYPTMPAYMYPGAMPMMPGGPQPLHQPAVNQPVMNETVIEWVEETVDTYECWWKRRASDSEKAPSACDFKFNDEESLLDHVMKVHFAEGQSAYYCCWRKCPILEQRHGKGGLKNREKAIAHFKTHAPFVTKTVIKKEKERVRPAARAPTQAQYRPRMSFGGYANPMTVQAGRPAPPSTMAPPTNPPVAETPNLVGIPLTSVLILRNIARASKKKENIAVQTMFSQSERDLAILMSVDARFTRFIGQILSELA